MVKLNKILYDALLDQKFIIQISFNYLSYKIVNLIIQVIFGDMPNIVYQTQLVILSDEHVTNCMVHVFFTEA